jgi:transcriptional regulator
MYVHPAFRMPDDEAWAFVAARGFGMVVAVGEGRPAAVHVPLHVDRTNGDRIQFHVARANPLHTIIAANPAVLVCVTGPDAYISPDWYESAEQVPTWNYVAAHLDGEARVLTPTDAEGHVTRVSDEFEGRLAPKPAWKMEKLSERRKAMMLSAIVGFEVRVDAIAAVRKLSQNKSEEDQAAAALMLAHQGDWAASAIAALMPAGRHRPAR